MGLMEWMKSFLAHDPMYRQTPDNRIFLNLREHRDAELEDARERVERLLEELKSRDMRTHNT